MKQKLIILCGTLLMAVVTVFAVKSNSSSHIAQVMLDNVEALSQREGGGSSLKNQVVGCGSYSFHDWKAGCCPGYSGCSFSNCSNAICN